MSAPRLLGHLPLAGEVDAGNGCAFDACGAYRYAGALLPPPPGRVLFAVAYAGWRQVPGNPYRASFAETATFEPVGERLKADPPLDLPDCGGSCAGGAVDDPADAPCVALVARQIAAGVSRPADSGCWRVGPLRLGMTTAEVAAKLSAPDLTERRTDEFAGPETLWFYVFPRGRETRPNGGRADAPGPDVLELAFSNGALAAISNDPPMSFRGEPCARTAPTAESSTWDPEFSPYREFAGVDVFDPLASLEARFGRAPMANASHDFFSYFPTPIAFDVDPDGRTIAGFSIATDSNIIGSLAAANFRVIRDPATCAVIAYQLIERTDIGL